MHSMNCGDTVFVFHGDHSGNVTIRRNEQVMEVPFKDLLALVGGAIKTNLTAKLENIDPWEVFKFLSE
jgi:hypothetical protein